MRLILGDNSFFGVNHAKTTKSVVVRDFDTYSETIDYAYEALGLESMMISPHPNYLDLLSRVKKPMALTVLVPMPQNINKEIAVNGWARTILNYTKDAALFIRRPTFIISAATRGLRARSAKYIFFYCFFLIEIMRVIKETDDMLPNVTAIGLHNLMTDMLIAGDNTFAFQAFVDAAEDAKVNSVFVTQNIAALCRVLSKLRLVRKPTICGSYNQLGYMANPDICTINSAIDTYKNQFEFWAMHILCSGHIDADNLDTKTFSAFDAVLIASRKTERLKQLTQKLATV